MSRFWFPWQRRRFEEEQSDIERAIFSSAEEKDKKKLWLLGLVAPFLAKEQRVCNNFEEMLNSSRQTLYAELENRWNIKDSNMVVAKCSWLLSGEHTVRLDKLHTALGRSAREDICNIANVDTRQANQMISMYKKGCSMFEEYHLPIPQGTLYAWDLTQAALISLLALACEYISFEQSRKIMLAAIKLASDHYSTWTKYASASLFGFRLQTMQEDWATYCRLATTDEDIQRVHALIFSGQSFYSKVRIDEYVHLCRDAQKVVASAGCIPAYLVEQ